MGTVTSSVWETPVQVEKMKPFVMDITVFQSASAGLEEASPRVHEKGISACGRLEGNSFGIFSSGSEQFSKEDV